LIHLQCETVCDSTPGGSGTPQERLQKVIAQAGVASRRRAETLIKEGAVRVNGAVVRELGVRVDPTKDRIDVRGQRIVRQRQVYLLLNKPRGTVTTAEDPEGRKTVIDLLKGVQERVFSVGRLDYNTSGALLLTNDGELAQALGHPSSGVPRVYRVKVGGALSVESLESLRKGVNIGDVTVRATEVHIASRTSSSTTVMLTLREGRNHQIHRMMEAVGHRVMKLVRVSFAGLEVEGLKPGEHRHLKGRELGKLKRLYVTPYRASRRAQSRLR